MGAKTNFRPGYVNHQYSKNARAGAKVRNIRYTLDFLANPYFQRRCTLSLAKTKWGLRIRCCLLLPLTLPRTERQRAFNTFQTAGTEQQQFLREHSQVPSLIQVAVCQFACGTKDDEARVVRRRGAVVEATCCGIRSPVRGQRQ